MAGPNTNILLLPSLGYGVAVPAGTPNIFGGSGHGLSGGMGDGCSGQLFGFSGLDGPTFSTTNFVGVFENASNYDLRLCTDTNRFVRLRVPSSGGGGGSSEAPPAAVVVLAAANDALVALHPAAGDSDGSGGGNISLAWRRWDLLVGALPPRSVVSMDGAAPLAAPPGAPAGMVCVGAAAKAAVAAATVVGLDCADLAGTWARPGNRDDSYTIAMGAGAGSGAFTASSPRGSWRAANGTIVVGSGGGESAAVTIAYDNGVTDTGTCTSHTSGAATTIGWVASTGGTWERAAAAADIVLCRSADGGGDGDGGVVGMALAYGATEDALAAAAAAAGDAAATSGAAVDADVQARLGWVDGTPRLSSSQRQLLLNKCVSVMRVNSLAPEGTITQHWSTPDRVPHKYMWLWDSCYHSMARSVLNDTLGWEFVQSMLSVQAPSGAVPIERSPLGADALAAGSALRGAEDAEVTAAPAGAIGGIGGIGGIDTTQTQPPLLCWAIWENFKLAQAAGGAGEAAGLARLAYAVPRLERYLQWDFANRGDPTGATPLLYWLKGTESGMDNSQRFDGYRYQKPLLAVDFSVFAARESALLADMHGALGNATGAAHWAAVAAAISAAVHEQLWDASRGFYFDRYDSANGGRFSDVAAVTGLLPLWLPDLPADRLAPLLAAIADPAKFNTPVPLPSVAADTKHFSTDMWRGPMWLNTNWHVALGLLSKNQTAAARRLLGATVDAVDAWYRVHGVLFEFYDARNATDPTTLLRKGKVSGGIRDYHWTAALTFRMLLELEALEGASDGGDGVAGAAAN